MSENIGVREKISAGRTVAKFRPTLTVLILVLSVGTALLEGIGLSFILPVIELAQGNDVGGESGLLGIFVSAYRFAGVPFTLEYIVAGVTLVMAVRFIGSFLVLWLQSKLQTEYIRYLQSESFSKALNAEVSYFDERGSDEILNTIVTQSEYAGRVIRSLVRLVEQGLISLMYVGIALYLSPLLTIGTAIVIGLLMYGFRIFIESGYAVGNRVATANEQIQQIVQAGTQGIRDVKLFHLTTELWDDFQKAVDRYTESYVALRRNEAAINNFNQFLTAVTVFGLIFIALEFSILDLGSLSVFLFAMFRLGPKVSTLNSLLYQLDGNLPHFVRTDQFVSNIAERLETGGDVEPRTVSRVEFNEVSFGYGDETVLRDLSFAVERGEFIAFVGQSGAGKSTIVSLLTRMYDPDRGFITGDGTPIQEFDLDAWRSRIAVVRQDPYIFNETLRKNITIGNSRASDAEIERVCKAARITEFLPSLPGGLDTVVGEEGVRLSGGQRQRVALARALLKDADILVLDEATSNLDVNIEKEVQDSIESMDNNYAVIAIAHRLSTIVNADRIYTVENGRITESGSHEELLSQSGKYNELYVAQTE